MKDFVLFFAVCVIPFAMFAANSSQAMLRNQQWGMGTYEEEMAVMTSARNLMDVAVRLGELAIVLMVISVTWRIKYG